VDLKLYPERAKRVAELLISTLNDEGIFGLKELPDDLAYSVKTDADTYLNFLSLTTALDYMRDAGKLWQSSIETLKDGETNWVFSPKAVSSSKPEELIKALSKHKLAIRKNRDSRIWLTISRSISEKFGGSFVNLFKSFDFNVKRMFDLFGEKEYGELFPSLSGRKIFPHWIRILREKTKLEFKGVEELPIPVDVHVARATFTTGCIRGRYSSKGIGEPIRRRVIELWDKALKGSGVIPVEMFRPLWLLSRNGCHYRKEDDRPKLGTCPASDFCVEGKVILSAKRVEIDT